MPDRIWDGDPELHAEAEAERRRYWRANARDEAERRELELIRFADIQPRLDGRPLIKGLLEREQISLVFGETGSCKTFLALDVGLHIAAGLDRFGRKVEQGGVVYVAAEAGRGIVNRVVAWRTAHGLDGQDIPFAAITSSVDLCHPNIGDLDRLIDLVKGTRLGPLALVEIDTVSRVLTGGNENAPNDMGALVCSLDQLRAELRSMSSTCTTWARKSFRGPRGHSLLRAAVDTEIEVTRDAATGISTATVTKQSDGPTEGEIVFRLQSVLLGIDQDGEEITSCIIEPLGQPQATRPRRQPKLSNKQKIALDMLRKALAEDGVATPPGNQIPSAATVVDVDLWRRYFYAAVGSNDTSAEARKKAFRRVREALQAMRPPIIGIWNELVWVVDSVP